MQNNEMWVRAGDGVVRRHPQGDSDQENDEDDDEIDGDDDDDDDEGDDDKGEGENGNAADSGGHSEQLPVKLTTQQRAAEAKWARRHDAIAMYRARAAFLASGAAMVLPSPLSPSPPPSLTEDDDDGDEDGDSHNEEHVEEAHDGKHDQEEDDDEKKLGYEGKREEVAGPAAIGVPSTPKGIKVMPDSFDLRHMQTLRQCFDSLDTDESQAIAPAELMKAMRSDPRIRSMLSEMTALKPLLKPGTFRKVFERMDEDSNGEVTFDEFASFCAEELAGAATSLAKAEDARDRSGGGGGSGSPGIQPPSQTSRVAAEIGTRRGRLSGVFKRVEAKPPPELPPPATAAELEAKADKAAEAALGVGRKRWTRYFDEDSGRYYFVHSDSGKTTWKDPFEPNHTPLMQRAIAAMVERQQKG